MYQENENNQNKPFDVSIVDNQVTIFNFQRKGSVNIIARQEATQNYTEGFQVTTLTVLPQSGM